MGLFDIFKKKEQPKESHQSKVLLAMVIFGNGDRYELSSIIDNLKSSWNLDVTNLEGGNETAAFNLGDEVVAIAYMPAPIPDIEGAAQYAYNWPTASQDLKEHNGHALVTILSGKRTTLERFRHLSKVLYSILTTSNAIGVYQGSQSLLIPKDQYLDSAEELRTNGMPVNLWVYIGLRRSDAGDSVYTYGLTEFGKQEMEVIDSKMDLEDLYVFMGNICAYVIGSNVTFRSGETLGYTEEQKIKITSSKGRFVDGYSLKLEM